MTTTATSIFDRPFPALTTAQRYHFDLYGYVIVPGTLTSAECAGIRDALQRLRRDLIAANPQDPKSAQLQGAFFEAHSPHHDFMANFYEYDDHFLDYACHPRLVGMAEEIMGCEARITELNRYRKLGEPLDDKPRRPVP
ncbi:MAG: phytanoyl-CoA dioxygenase family protein [Verrucomicrobiota bacterium]